MNFDDIRVVYAHDGRGPMRRIFLMGTEIDLKTLDVPWLAGLIAELSQILSQEVAAQAQRPANASPSAKS